MTSHDPHEKPMDLGDVPEEEGVSEADAADRIDLDPEEQENYTEKHGQRTQVNQDEPETPPDREESIELDAPEYDEA